MNIMVASLCSIISGGYRRLADDIPHEVTALADRYFGSPDVIRLTTLKS